MCISPRVVRPARILSLLWFSLLLAGCGGGGGISSPSNVPTVPTATLSLSASPGTLTVYDGTTFIVTVTAVTSGTNATPSITLGQLPAGLTTTTAFPLSIPAGGAQIAFVAASTLAPAKYTIPLNGTAGTATASASLTATVATGTPPSFYFANTGPLGGILGELVIPAGTSGQIKVQSYADNNAPADYEVQLSVDGLPTGTTATISPPDIIPGQAVTVSMSAASSAPITQNATVTLIGTPLAPVPSASAAFLAEITGADGMLPTNRTDYVSTEGTPNSAVYDSSHNLIFSSNPSWNRIDVISNVSHKIVRSIPVMHPQGIDITLNDSQVWIATASEQVYCIDTTTFSATRYQLPDYSPFSTSTDKHWQGRAVFALADGTFFLNVMPGETANTGEYGLIWNPATNALTGIAPPSGSKFPALWGTVMRTGDGKRVYSIASDSGGESFSYDVLNKTVSSARQLGGYAVAATVNLDGSRVAVYDASGLNLYDGNFNLIGRLPGGGLLGPQLYGGLIFSPDGSTLYEESMPTDIPVIYTIDVSTRLARGVAPAMPLVPASILEMSPPFYLPTPFAVDATGMLLGVEDGGIAFDDANFYENLTIDQPGTPTFMQHMSPYAGPLSGGTTSSGFGNGVWNAPNVWYGANRGTASDNNGTLTITSPPASVAGPVNIKFLFPDGIEIFNPQFFTYGPDPEFAVISGASPEGNVAGRIAGLGLPTDATGGTVKVGGNSATITTQKSSYLPFTGDPFPSTFLDFTVPAGSPGWADVEVDTPNGNATLPNSLFYAKSVKDYSTTDTLTAVLYDPQRQKLYLSAQDHIDIFSLSSDQFLTPLSPPAQGSQKQFTGLALTPDGSHLLASDLLDGSLAVIDPDNPANSFAIPIAAETTDSSGCKIGPLYVASVINQQAYVVTGANPSGITCGPGGVVYQVNLTAKSAVVMPNAMCGGGNVAASHDGAVVAFGKNPKGYGAFCTYDASSNAYSFGGDYRASASISGDGNIAASQPVFFDPTAEVLGSVAQSNVYYPPLAEANLPGTTPLLDPQFNDSGGLYYVANPGYVDIIDVPHGVLRMRFSLKENVANVISPIAIDSGGQHIYLITDQGLTVVDLGEAPLSIGHLSPAVGSTGGQITVRGSGFATGITATVGGQIVSVNRVDENTLTLVLPALPSGPQDVVLTNVDGSAYKLENAITVQ